MSGKTCLVIGGGGYVGSAISAVARRRGWELTTVGAENYGDCVGAGFDVVINANGNALRFKANEDPLFDFQASAVSVYRSLFDFHYKRYLLVSTVDVYNDPSRGETTAEDTPIDPLGLAPYAFHKWLAESFVIRQCPHWQIFRLAQMVGPGLKKGPVFDLLRNKPSWIDPRTRLHFMNTLHVAETIFRLLELGPANEVFNVCGRGNVEFQRVCELFPGGAAERVEGAGERQVYQIDVGKASRFVTLPDSWCEVREFILTQLGGAA